MTLRLAVIGTHPIPFRSQLFQAIAQQGQLDLRSFFCCDWGLESYQDPEFKISVKWNVPLLDGYQYEFLPIGRRPTKLNFWQVDNPSVDAALDRFNPDVVMVFGYAQRTNWRASAWARRRSKPVLLMSDSSVLASTSVWKQMAKRVLVQYFYNRVSGALFIGDNNRAYHSQYGLSDERLFESVLPIDYSRLTGAVADRGEARVRIRKQWNIPLDAFVVMFCGKFIARKRPLDIVSAIGNLSRLDVPIWALLVGEGPDRVAIESYCSTNGLKNVVMTGFTDPQSVPQYYAASDVFISSADRDPHPIPVTEATAFGLPIIISDRVGCIGENDIARPGVNAIVYPFADVEGLRGSIETLYRDKELYRRMSEASTQIATRQDVGVAASAIANAATRLHDMGPR